jgi:hypothetical protein
MSPLGIQSLLFEIVGSEDHHLSIPTIQPLGCHHRIATHIVLAFLCLYRSPQTTLLFGESQIAQSFTWAIVAEPDRSLVDRSTGIEVSYLLRQTRSASASS